MNSNHNIQIQLFVKEEIGEVKLDLTSWPVVRSSGKVTLLSSDKVKLDLTSWPRKSAFIYEETGETLLS